MEEKLFQDFNLEDITKPFQEDKKLSYNTTQRELQLQINQQKLAFDILTSELSNLEPGKVFNREKWFDKTKKAFEKTFNIRGVAIITEHSPGVIGIDPFTTCKFARGFQLGGEVAKSEELKQAMAEEWKSSCFEHGSGSCPLSQEVVDYFPPCMYNIKGEDIIKAIELTRVFTNMSLIN